MSKEDPLRTLKVSMGITGTTRDKRMFLILVPVLLVGLFASRYLEDSVYTRKRNDEAVLEKKWANEEEEALTKIGRRKK